MGYLKIAGGNGSAVIVFLVLVGLVISFCLSYFFAEVAEMKGHNKIKYLIICFVFGLAGWIMVAALPDRMNDNEIDEWKKNQPEQGKAEQIIQNIQGKIKN